MQLSDLKWTDVATLSRDVPVVIPIAALEQHGRHMPLFTDSLLLGEVIRRTADVQQARLVEVWREYSAEELTSDHGRFSFRARHADGFSLPVTLSLRGRHQVENALAATAAARDLSALGFPVSTEHIRQGLATAEWPAYGAASVLGALAAVLGLPLLAAAIFSRLDLTD